MRLLDNFIPNFSLTMTLTPIGDHIIVKASPAEETTKGGIIIPDTASKERPEKGEVIAVGPGKLLENGQRAAMDVAVGQTVLFKKYAPDEITLDGEKFLVITATDVMATVS